MSCVIGGDCREQESRDFPGISRSAVFAHFLHKVSSQLPPLSFFYPIQTVLMNTKVHLKTHAGLEERSACINPCVFLCAVSKPKVVDSADFYHRSCASCRSVPTLVDVNREGQQEQTVSTVSIQSLFCVRTGD